MFKIGEYIINPRAGVCLVKDIVHLDQHISGSDKNTLYYLLSPIDNVSEKIYLPTEHTDKTARKIMTKEEALSLLENFHKIPEIKIENEKTREQRYKETIRKGNPEELLGIIKQLYMKKLNREKNGKHSNATDESYFKTIENRLYSEIALSIGKTKDEVYHMIQEIAGRQ